MDLKRRISLYAQSIFYLIAGLNHFINPNFYTGLIPDYLPNHSLINIFSGIIEILLGFGLLLSFSRKYAALGLVAMLIAFIPSHVYFIQIGSCVPNGLCTPEWIGWVRLVVIHPLLILWAWNHRK